MSDFPLLVTSAIITSAPFVKFDQSADRLNATIEALLQWRKIEPNLKIVVCDGSNFDLHEHVCRLIPDISNFEFLKFQNNFKKVKELGKGSGEGEIINFALENSVFLKESNIFAKCTGKLWVSNFKKCCIGFKEGIRIEKSYPNTYLKEITECDTRFYLTHKNFYNETLKYAHDSINDYNDYYLEHAFADIIVKNKIKTSIFPVAPLIFGRSGSMGNIYCPTTEDFRAKVKRSIRLTLGW